MEQEDDFKFSPVLTKKERVSADLMADKEELALNKLDGSPLGLMGTFPSLENKIFRYSEGMKKDTSPVRRDRPDCRVCRE